MSANGGKTQNMLVKKDHRKIGIVGLWYRQDISSALGDFALYKVLEELGNTPVLLNKPLDLWPEEDMSNSGMTNKFIYKNCTVYPVCRTKEDYYALNQHCDTFLVASGEVWNYDLCRQSGQYFFLDFVSDANRKIAYGSSFGLGCQAPKAEQESSQEYFKKFDAVSVCDDSDIELCQQFDIQPQKVIEPLLLCSNETLKSCIANEKPLQMLPYLVVSTSEISTDEWAFLQYTAKVLRLDILNLEKAEIPVESEQLDSEIDLNEIEPKIKKRQIVKEMKFASAQQIEDYLNIIYNSGFVIANNYTMTALAIKFQKPFAVLIHEEHPDYCKILSLLKTLGLTNRMLYLNAPLQKNYEYLFTERIDFECAEKKLTELKENSLKWLQTALDKDKIGSLEDCADFAHRIPQHVHPRIAPTTISFKLQNIVLPDKQYLDNHWWMLYRGDRMIRRDGLGCYALPENGTIEFFTYFNAFSVQKWKKYTGIENVELHLLARGSFRLHFVGHFFHNEIMQTESFREHTYELEEAQEIILPLPKSSCSVMGFEITAIEDFELYSGYYSVEIYPDQLNPVELTIATTTFKKEEFIIPNMELIKRDLLESNEEIAEHLMVNIIDNGRTLEAEKYNCERMRVYPNLNVGGAGGFTRGMLEALNAPVKPTHILLMDDDVIILPESIKRTYNLLRLLKQKHQSDFISGAMLYYERMNIQHEDVGFVSTDDGGYGPCKPEMEMHAPEAVLRNEVDYERHDYPYAGWWYCCIPTSVIESIGLPLPIFIRGDDVEYSLRNHANFITMNGICIWHMGFVTKFNAAMELYQVHRNSLIIQAISGVCEKVDFIERIKGFFWKEIRRYNYNGAELLLDAIEDYLQGPELLLKPNGEQIIKEHIKKNEPLVSLSQYPGHNTSPEAVYSDKPLTPWQKFLYKVTFNGHLYPKFLLKKTPAVIAYDWFESPGNQYMHEFLLAVNVHAKTGNMRYISRKKFLKLVLRYNKLMKRYRRENAQVTQNYKESMNYFTSFKFWEKYLGIKQENRNESDLVCTGEIDNG